MIIQQPPAFCASPTRSIPTLTVTPDEQTKQELVALSEQRMNQINKRTHDVEERLSVREQELAKTKQQFAQLTQDFRYNLKLLEDRDAELERLDAAIVTHRAAAEKADNALQQQKNLVTEREAEVRREKSRIAELEAYYKEKVERLAKQTDDARNSKDEELQKQKDDFLVLERQLVRQLEEQKTLLEAQRADMHAQVAERGKRAEEEAKEPIALLQAELHQEKAQSLALAGELEAAQGVNQGFKDEIQAAVDDKREAEREAADCRERVVAVEELLESMRGELDAVKEFNATEKAAEVEADAEAINAQKEKERTLATTVQDQKDEIAELKKKVKELEASLETAAESVKKAEEDAKAAAEQAETAKAAAEAIKAKAEEEAKKPPEPEPAAQVPATPRVSPRADLRRPPRAPAVHRQGETGGRGGRGGRGGGEGGDAARRRRALGLQRGADVGPVNIHLIRGTRRHGSHGGGGGGGQGGGGGGAGDAHPDHRHHLRAILPGAAAARYPIAAARVGVWATVRR